MVDVSDQVRKTLEAGFPIYKGIYIPLIKITVDVEGISISQSFGLPQHYENTRCKRIALNLDFAIAT